MNPDEISAFVSIRLCAVAFSDCQSPDVALAARMIGPSATRVDVPDRVNYLEPQEKYYFEQMTCSASRTKSTSSGEALPEAKSFVNMVPIVPTSAQGLRVLDRLRFAPATSKGEPNASNAQKLINPLFRIQNT